MLCCIAIIAQEAVAPEDMLDQQPQLPAPLHPGAEPDAEALIAAADAAVAAQVGLEAQSQPQNAGVSFSLMPGCRFCRRRLGEVAQAMTRHPS